MKQAASKDVPQNKVFIKVSPNPACLQPIALLKKTPTQMLSCEFCKILKEYLFCKGYAKSSFRT